MYYDFALHHENLLEKRSAKSPWHFTEQNHEDRRAKRSEIVLGGTMSDVSHVLTGILPVKCVLLGKTHGYTQAGAMRAVNTYGSCFPYCIFDDVKAPYTKRRRCKPPSLGTPPAAPSEKCGNDGNARKKSGFSGHFGTMHICSRGETGV